MRIDFDEQVPVPPEGVFDCMRSPTEWPRLYGSFGAVSDLGGGWYEVPLAGGPPHLEARVTALELDRHAAWELRGTFAGAGEIHLEANDDGTRITGFETVEVVGIADPNHLAAVAKSFERIWQMGWDRLRSIDRTSAPGS